jgi:demethylmenaquinone methyltransferase / 2-methoxy-6-polyprenyl-1,4-benzoquinol methylase
VQSKFYRPDEQRAEKVQALFATIARRYDLLNDIMSAGLHRHWKRRLVEMAGEGGEGRRARGEGGTEEGGEREAGSGKRKRILDLCCGTGDIAMEFLLRTSTDVIGADFTAEMLRVASTRAAQHSITPSLHHPISWVQADALRLPFPDNSFDVVGVGYGLRNLADIERGLREIWRVLRPGGKLLSLDFGKPESAALRWLYFGYLRTVLPVLGRIYCGDPDTHSYILASLQDYPAQRGIKELMESCGYRGCGFVEFVGGTMAINFGDKPG